MTDEKQEITMATEPEAEEQAPAQVEEEAQSASASAAAASEEAAAAEEDAAEKEAAAAEKDEAAQKKERRWYPRRRKYCRFCAEKREPDYKDPEYLRQFLTDRFKIIPRRITGTCAYHQRRLTKAVKRARILALLPYTTLHKGWFTHEVQKVVRER